MATKQQSIIQENLCKLYLRLNGYLTTGFILHDERDNYLKGELDLIGVRFPYHEQDETEHNSSPYFEVPANIDVVIGEVKSKGMKLQFNGCISSFNDPAGWEKILKWLGILSSERVQNVAESLNRLVISPKKDKREYLLNLPVDTGFGIITIRPVLFSPERINLYNEPKFIHWTEINDFIWTCLCPVPGSRAECGTRYDFDLWGAGLIEIVRAYKVRQKAQQKFKNISELYQEVK